MFLENDVWKRHLVSSCRLLQTAHISRIWQHGCVQADH